VRATDVGVHHGNFLVDRRCDRITRPRCAEDVDAIAALLDVLAVEVHHLDLAVRRQVVDTCRIVLEEKVADLASPHRRR
jgi:hypothetical protein